MVLIFFGLSTVKGCTGVPAIIKCSPGGETEGVMLEIKNIPFVVYFLPTRKTTCRVSI